MGYGQPATSFSLPESALPALAQKYMVPGIQLAIHHSGSTACWEIGELEIRTGCRVTEDAVFPVGSITKCVTASVVTILAADGDVDPDEPITGHVPEAGELGRRLTPRQLLSHTSGLADLPGMAETSSLSLRRYVAEHVRPGNFVRAPGTGFSYSTLGYALAGRLIETVTGMSWAEAVEAILLRPLGIDAAFTGTPRTWPGRRPCATGHSVNRGTGRIRPVCQSGGPAISPAGGLALSAGDLIKLGLMHTGPSASGPLPAASARAMREPVAQADPFGLADGWGMGLAVYRWQAGHWVGHDGNADGTSCHLRISPADDWVIAITTNGSTGTALWQELQAELAQAGIPIGPPRAAAPCAPHAAPPPGCAGRYVNGEVEYEVTWNDSGFLCLSLDGEDAMPLTIGSDLTFSAADPASAYLYSGRFVREPATGEIRGIQAGGRFAARPAVAGTAAPGGRDPAPAG